MQEVRLHTLYDDFAIVLWTRFPCCHQRGCDGSDSACIQWNLGLCGEQAWSGASCSDAEQLVCLVRGLSVPKGVWVASAGPDSGWVPWSLPPGSPECLALDAGEKPVRVPSYRRLVQKGPGSHLLYLACLEEVDRFLLISILRPSVGPHHIPFLPPAGRRERDWALIRKIAMQM